MQAPIKTFDVFDTLIARRCVEPTRLFEKLQALSSLPGLAAARMGADPRLGAIGRPYMLRDIWLEVRRAMGLDAVAAERLMDLEIQIEHEEVIPIPENLAQVRDGDVLVSDTYLPADTLLSLLRKAGLKRAVAVVVSNDGKFRGWIWRQLLAKVAIAEHFGDNPHSDGKTPSEAGIKAVIYTGARRSPIEQLLVERGWESLAQLVREVRLANPFPMSQLAERHLWLLSSQLNFPLLFFASLLLERHVAAVGSTEILFVSRDCQLWHCLYRWLFPHRRATYLYTSRMCLIKPSENYLSYFRSTWHPESVIVDLFSTGASWSRLFSRLEARAKCYFIGRVDDYSYLASGPRPEERLDMTCVFRNSELGTPVNKGVEMLNYGCHPVVEDVIPLPGGASLPVLAETLEYDPSLPAAAHRSFRACIKALDHQPDLTQQRAEALDDVIKAFVRMICADPRLPSIYAGHQAADLAYLQRILA